MLKIVLDTNIYLSALIYGGMAESILDLVASDQLKLFVSPGLTIEILKKFQEKGADENILQKLNVLLNHKGIMIKPQVTVTTCRDPEDNFLLELAQAAQADYLITRDKDLLEMPNHAWKTAKILKPEDFLPLLRSKKISS